MSRHVLQSFLAFLLSAGLTAVLIRSRRMLPWLEREPTTERWHKSSTPSMGGLSMFLAFLIVSAAAGLLEGKVLPVVYGGTIVFLLGLADDLRRFPPYVKLVGQIAAACFMVILGVHVAFTQNPLVYTPLTILWIVGITNAFNLLDNMDGLAAGIALIALAVLAFLTVLGAPLVPLPLLLILGGAVLGFLAFNVHPARIFMGDCGSQWLGFTLACLTIMDTWKSASNLAMMLASPVLLLAVPIFDTTLVTLGRKISGRPVSVGGKDHTSHRLVALGFSEARTVFMLWAVAALFGGIAVTLHYASVQTWGLFAAAGIIFALLVGVFLTDVKVYGPESPPVRPIPTVHAHNVLYKRRIVEILIDTVLIGASYVLAYLLKYDWQLDEYLRNQIAETLPVVVAVKLLVMLGTGLYRGLWTYIDFQVVGRLVKVTLLGSVVTILVLLGAYRFVGFSRTLFAIDAVLLLGLMGGARAFLRVLRESVFPFPTGGIRLLVAGAGPAGRFLLEEVRKNRHWNLRPVAIVDDDTDRIGKEILGVPVLGSFSDLPRLTRELRIDHIVIASQPADPDVRENLESLARESGAPYVTMASLEETVVRTILS